MNQKDRVFDELLKDWKDTNWNALMDFGWKLKENFALLDKQVEEWKQKYYGENPSK